MLLKNNNMEEKDNKKVILRKIALKTFIETLVNVYNSGADYIDLVGNNNKEQDTIGIIVTDEYMSDDDESIELIPDEEEEIEEEPKKLSDKDLDDLI